MSSLNRVTLIGNLGKDPETRYMSNGDAVSNVTIATTDTWKDKDGQKQEKTEWHRVTFYRKLAEIVQEHLNKGSPVWLEGRLETRKWTDKAGVERFTTEIIAHDVKFLGGKKEGGKPKPNGFETGKQESREEMVEDGIPF
jgi:single-strand DNA-binding protein